MKIKKIIGYGLLGILMLSALIILLSVNWYIRVFGDKGFAAVLFTLSAGITGTSDSLKNQYIAYVVLFSIGIVLVISCILFVLKQSGIIKKRNKTVPTVIVIASIIMIGFSVVRIGIPEWIINKSEKSTLYEDEYVNPDEAHMRFPEKKRNLIYIFLESMETSYLAESAGGAYEENLIPELYELAKDNINFSHNEDVGGWPEIVNTNWTVASLLAQTSGIPLSIPIDGNSFGYGGYFLPGLVTLSDVLHNNGYYQAFMCGSDSTFGGRNAYFSQHNTDDIYDYYTAIEEGFIPEDYLVWWGLEDARLYDYAKLKLADISKNDEPFAVSILTVDTHHVGGYICNKCDLKYAEINDNVIACASRQVYEFIEWCKSQDFYENTTIVVCGDHTSMDAEYFARNVDSEYDRHIYNCIINSAVSTDDTQNRKFSPMDMFPTVLAAMGCEIEGERLGLGVNLFSGEATLAEKYGIEEFNNILAKDSKYYTSYFVKNKKKNKDESNMNTNI